jgi:hypothetical protein
VAIALVSGQKAAAGGGAGLTTVAVSYPAATTAGNLLLLHVGGSQRVSTVTDDGGNTWRVIKFTAGEAGVGASEIWYCWNCLATTTVTATFVASATFRFATVSEYSGADNVADPFDHGVGSDDQGTAAASITVPDRTPAVNGELVYCAGRNTGVGPSTVNSPFTQLSGAGFADCDGYVVQGAASAAHGDVNNTGDTHWTVHMATFRPSGTNPVPPATWASNLPMVVARKTA